MPTATKAPEHKRLELKAAVQIAAHYFAELFPDLSANNLMLEEVDESKDRKFWMITLGYDAKRVLSPHLKVFQPEIYRQYKTFKINSATGEVVSMKIRTVD